MPIIKSAKKRVRVALKQSTQNAKTKKSLRTSIKTFQAAVADKKDIAKAQSGAQSAIDTAVKKGVISKNKAARTKSRLNAQAKAANGGKQTAVKKTARKAAPKAPAKTAPAKTAADDLTKIEGIGPKINDLLHAADIKTFQNLADAPTATVKQVLADAGSRYASHDPGTWGKQAQLAADGKFEELQTLQDQLDGGK